MKKQSLYYSARLSLQLTNSTMMTYQDRVSSGKISKTAKNKPAILISWTRSCQINRILFRFQKAIKQMSKSSKKNGLRWRSRKMRRINLCIFQRMLSSSRYSDISGYKSNHSKTLLMILKVIRYRLMKGSSLRQMMESCSTLRKK